MNRRIVRRDSYPSIAVGAEIDVAAVASVSVSSEASLYPIDNVFDGQRGPGGSCWMAGADGAQTIVVAFDSPHPLRSVRIEMEERERTSRHSVELATSSDAGATFDSLPAHDVSFTPYGVTYHEDSWTFALDAVTHVRLCITPTRDESRPSSVTARASLSSLVLR